MSDRLIIHTVQDDRGGTELYWARTEEDFPGPSEFNSVLLLEDGSITWKGWTDAEVPVVVQIKGNRVLVAVAEDQPPDLKDVVFDSATLK